MISITLHRSLLPLIFLTILAAVSTANAYYDPGIQRWVNRDPLGELGFELDRSLQSSLLLLKIPSENPYLFCRNDTPDLFDPLGLDLYHDCLQGCLDQLRQRYNNTDTCARWGLAGGAAGGAAGGFILGAGKGRGFSTAAVVSSLMGVASYAAIQVIGTIYADAIWIGCAGKCYWMYNPPPLPPTPRF